MPILVPHPVTMRRTQRLVNQSLLDGLRAESFERWCTGHASVDDFHRDLDRIERLDRHPTPQTLSP